MPVILPIEPHELLAALEKELKLRITSSTPLGDQTAAIRRIMYDLGTARGYKVCAHDYDGEYLLDVIWQRRPEKADIVLGLESEWGHKGDVWEDFEKLMHVKCPLKVAIVSGKSKGVCLTLAHDLQMFGNNLPGETYMVIELSRDLSATGHLLQIPDDIRTTETDYLRFDPMRRSS